MSYLDRTLIRGDDRKVSITVRNAAGQPIDLSGCKVYFTLNLSDNPANDASAGISKSTTTHVDAVTGLPSATAGKTTITLTHTEMEDVAPGVYWFDAQVRDAFGQIVSKQKARITVEADITRSIA